MRSVYALLIGIAEYPAEISPLYGCTNDTRQLDIFFKETFTESNGFRYQSTILLDNQAKRKAIIKAFSIFDAASGEDICIFYYSGHGSLVKTDSSFWTDGTEELNSLVCYDSRFPSGYDLIDKELSYLIWKATYNKENLHFVTIMDCCFAGANTRDVTEISRMFDKNENVKEVKELLGYETFVNGVPPRGRYVALSASQKKQTAKEKIINGEYHGVFTYFLTQCLKQQPSSGNYHSLIEKVKLLTKLNVRDQVPALESFQTDDSTPIFGINTLPTPVNYSLYYDDEWKINKGSVHGIKPADQLRLAEGETIIVTEVDMVESTVEVQAALDEKKIYQVFPQTTIPITLNFFIDDDTQTIQAVLEKEIKNNRYEGIRFINDRKNADYRIAYHETELIAMTDPEPQSLPRFKTVYIQNPAIFLERLQHVARWASVVNLFNPEGIEFMQHIEVELYSGDETSLNKIGDPSQTPLKYSGTIGNSIPPKIRLIAKNNYHRSLHISLLYCSCNFSVIHDLLPNTMIDRGKEIPATYTDKKGKQSDLIPIHIPRLYQELGITRVTEYAVFLVSNYPISSSDFVLKPLPLEDKKTKKSAEANLRGPDIPETQIEKPVWGTVKIPLRIEL